jgi:hypothetical protein
MPESRCNNCAVRKFLTWKRIVVYVLLGFILLLLLDPWSFCERALLAMPLSPWHTAIVLTRFAQRDGSRAEPYLRSYLTDNRTLGYARIVVDRGSPPLFRTTVGDLARALLDDLSASKSEGKASPAGKAGTNK